LQADNCDDQIPYDVALCIYRVAQEALRNILRHANAKQAEIKLQRFGNELHLEVRDDGKGFDPHDVGKRISLGHASMRERMRLLDGTMDLISSPGKGTAVYVKLLLKGEGNEHPARAYSG
jgi:signal transduction histidine kinase